MVLDQLHSRTQPLKETVWKHFELGRNIHGRTELELETDEFVDVFHRNFHRANFITIIHQAMEREIDRSHEQPEQAISRPFCSLEIAVSSLLSPTIWTTSKRLSTTRSLHFALRTY